MRIQSGRRTFAVQISGARLHFAGREVLSLCDHRRHALLVSPLADPAQLDAAVCRALVAMQAPQRKLASALHPLLTEEDAPDDQTHKLLRSLQKDLIFATDPCLPTLWRKAMSRLGRAVGADRVRFFAGPQHQTPLTSHLIWDRRGIIETSSRHILTPTDPFLEAAWEGCLGILLPDTGDADALSPLAHRAMLSRPSPGSFVQLAVSNGAGHCGVIRVECVDHPRAWTLEELDAIRIVGRTIATLGVVAAA